MHSLTRLPEIRIDWIYPSPLIYFTATTVRNSFLNQPSNPSTINNYKGHNSRQNRIQQVPSSSFCSACVHNVSIADFFQTIWNCMYTCKHKYHSNNVPKRWHFNRCHSCGNVHVHKFFSTITQYHGSGEYAYFIY